MKWWIKLLFNESGKGGSQSQTTTVTTPDVTPMHQELLNAQMELEQQRQVLIDQYSGRYADLEKQQLETLASQADQQKQMQQELIKELSPTDQDTINQEIEADLIAKNLGYARGEIPDLTMEEAAGLEAYTQLSKEEILANVLHNLDTGMIGAKNTALSRGLGSSSYREELEAELGSQALGTIGSAEREIEGLKYQAAWDMPRATQIYDQGLLELQQAVNLQAEQNKGKLAAQLSALNVQSVNPIDLYSNVVGTRFNYGDGGASAAENARIAAMNPNSPETKAKQEAKAKEDYEKEYGAGLYDAKTISSTDADLYRKYQTAVSAGGNPTPEQYQAYLKVKRAQGLPSLNGVGSSGPEASSGPGGRGGGGRGRGGGI